TFGLIAATVIASFAGFMLEKAFKKEKAKKLRDRGKDVNEPLFNFPEQEANHHD
ncbi:TPA: branched-chain amino acid ABC transporter permease, partial [Enterococcus faecium]